VPWRLKRNAHQIIVNRRQASPDTLIHDSLFPPMKMPGGVRPAWNVIAGRRSPIRENGNSPEWPTRRQGRSCAGTMTTSRIVRGLFVSAIGIFTVLSPRPADLSVGLFSATSPPSRKVAVTRGVGRRPRAVVRRAIGDGYIPGVLIVEHEATVRSFLRTALEPITRIEEAADAEQALDILNRRAQATDVALVDQILPRRSGLEVLHITKSQWPWIRVAILTGSGSEDLAIQALRAGASDYLRKPIAVAALLQAVTRLTVGLGVRVPPTAASAAVADHVYTSPVHPNIRRALMFVSAHFAETITLADVARAAGLSRFHFCRLFHREIGVPFHEHLHEVRVRRAQTLLANRYMRVSEVAYAVGFNDLSHFDRTFRKMIGQSPSEYRASLQCA